MHPEIVKQRLEEEINGFERTTINRILSCFDDIESAAKEKRRSFIESKSEKFNPDRDDESCIEEEGYFIELNHLYIETTLKQEYINSIATWLFHLFERQKKRMFGSDKTVIIKSKLAQYNYNLNSCMEWRTLNKELRLAANAIKHGSESDAAKELLVEYSHLFDKGCVVISKNDIERYLASLRNFWNKALDGQVVL